MLLTLLALASAQTDTAEAVRRAELVGQAFEQRIAEIRAASAEPSYDFPASAVAEPETFDFPASALKAEFDFPPEAMATRDESPTSARSKPAHTKLRAQLGSPSMLGGLGIRGALGASLQTERITVSMRGAMDALPSDGDRMQRNRVGLSSVWTPMNQALEPIAMVRLASAHYALVSSTSGLANRTHLGQADAMAGVQSQHGPLHVLAAAGLGQQAMFAQDFATPAYANFSPRDQAALTRTQGSPLTPRLTATVQTTLTFEPVSFEASVDATRMATNDIFGSLQDTGTELALQAGANLLTVHEVLSPGAFVAANSLSSNGGVGLAAGLGCTASF